MSKEILSMQDTDITFQCHVELKEGYMPVMADEEETEVTFFVKARNRATASRAIRAMLKDAPNVGNINIIAVMD